MGIDNTATDVMLAGRSLFVKALVFPSPTDLTWLPVFVQEGALLIPALETSEDACHRAAGEREGVWEVKELLTCQHLEAELWGSTHVDIWLPRPAHTQRALAAERMCSFP